MEKYSKQLVLDYIYGNDINGYDMEELENDPSFMSDVMRISKDKNMYFFSSVDVKKNYEFVKLVVEMFKDEQDFIIEVADFYLENATVDQDDISKDELNVIMNNIIKDKDKRLPYAFESMVLYETLLVDLRCVYNREQEKEELPDFGLGFIYIYDIYKQSPYITDFFATRMINRLFYSSKMSLEELIHQEFKNKENIYNQGINNSILNYIAMQDGCLSGYVSTNLNLIDNLYNEINKILNNWDLYETVKVKRKLDIIHQEGLSKYDEYKLVYSFCDYLETVLEKLGLTELYKKYCNDGVDGIILDEQNLPFVDKVYIEYLEGLVSNVFSEEKITNFSDIDAKKQPAKVVKFPKTLKNKEN